MLIWQVVGSILIDGRRAAVCTHNPVGTSHDATCPHAPLWSEGKNEHFFKDLPPSPVVKLLNNGTTTPTPYILSLSCFVSTCPGVTDDPGATRSRKDMFRANLSPARRKQPDSLHSGQTGRRREIDEHVTSLLLTFFVRLVAMLWARSMSRM